MLWNFIKPMSHLLAPCLILALAGCQDAERITATQAIYEESRPGSTLETALEIAPSSLTGATLKTPGAEHYYRISLCAPGTLNLFSTGKTDTQGALLYGSGDAITGADGTAVADSNSGTEFNFSFSEILPTDAYIVRIASESGHRGPYYLVSQYLSLITGTEDDHGESSDLATGIGLNSTACGQIRDSLDIDLFTFTTTESGAVVLSGAGEPGLTYALTDSGGTSLEFDEESPTAGSFSISRIVGADSYTLQVGDGESAPAGAYTLTLNFSVGS